jgi:hypothetical protein
MIAEQVEQEIKRICFEYKIKNYFINMDGTVDIEGDVELSSKGLNKIPLKFARIMGNFNIFDNQLTTLDGGPKSVGGNFNCFNNNLSNLVGAPRWVGGDFYCYHNQLISLEGSPAMVVGNFYVSGNIKLSNLLGCPLTVGIISFDDTLISTYSGDTDIEINADVCLNISHYYEHSDYGKLPLEIINNRQNLKLILKYQRYFEIWNDDLTLNIENFQVLIAEIKDGLQ